MDIQNAFLPMMDQNETPAAMESINALIGMFRGKNLPVIRVYHSEPELGPYSGQEAFEFTASVKILDSDARIVKNFPGAFTKTSLDSLLKAKGSNSVYLCGLSVAGCVLATYFGAMNRNYGVFIVRETVFSHYAAYTEVIRNITRTLPLSMVGLQIRLLSGDLTKLEEVPENTLRNSCGINSPDQLNIIGYSLVSSNRLRDAVIVMKTNLRLFPDEPNCYDSLGEVYERDNQKDQALANYEKAYLKAEQKNDKKLSVFEKNYQRLADAGK